MSGVDLISTDVLWAPRCKLTQTGPRPAPALVKKLHILAGNPDQAPPSLDAVVVRREVARRIAL
jgi:hypothetical protein